jgi:hypothetical protein
VDAFHESKIESSIATERFSSAMLGELATIKVIAQGRARMLGGVRTSSALSLPI